MINLNRKRTSRIIWETLLENTVSQPKIPWVDQLNMLDALRATAQAPTGSISLAAFWCLYSVVQAVKPKVVAEVGTYIGKSTLALVSGGATVCSWCVRTGLAILCLRPSGRRPRTTSWISKGNSRFPMVPQTRSTQLDLVVSALGNLCLASGTMFR